MQESQGEVWGSVLGIPGETVVLGPSSSVTFGCTSLVVVCAHQHTMGGGRCPQTSSTKIAAPNLAVWSHRWVFPWPVPCPGHVRLS